VAALLDVRQSHLLRRGGRGPSLRVGATSLHYGGGGVRRGLVKRRSPREHVRMARGDSDLHGGG
jgi:hypothetical protein